MQIEGAAMAEETSADAKERLYKLRREIADSEEDVNRLKAQWQSEKESLSGLKPLAEEIEGLRAAYETAFKKAQRTNSNEDYITAHQTEQKLRAAEQKLRELEQRAAESGAGGRRMVREEGEAQDLA